MMPSRRKRVAARSISGALRQEPPLMVWRNPEGGPWGFRAGDSR
ncbi:MAG TPA: hypothetical protein QF533_04575 [Nitrospinota bacterium]|nr:hypothetical protein [Nitrospinota bacterium]